MSNNMPNKSQQRAAIILVFVFLIVLLVLLAIMDFVWFFVALALILLGISLLRMKKPDLFSAFSRKKPVQPVPSAAAPPEQRRDAFTAHIILLYQGGVTMQQIMVDRAEFTIGRSPSCSFVLSGNTDISRVHATIRYDAERGCSTVTDNNSSHGTKVNGNYLNPGEARILHNGDLIQIEDRVLTVQNKNY